MPNKMTDNEIIKALKKILELMCYEGDLQRSATTSKALDLINRQKADYDKLYKSYLKNQEIFAEQSLENERLKAEIERLQKDRKRLKKVQMQLADLCIMHNIIKAEAYKEFAERSKKELYYAAFNEPIITEEDIDEILKEMVSEDK